MILFSVIVFILISVMTVFIYFNKSNKCTRKLKNAKTLICIGSGGHTAEMLRILNKMNPEKYTPRNYVMADNDTTSETKVISFESNFNKKSFSISKIYRSRAVGQSYLSSVFTTMYAILTSIPVVFNFKPDVILCNGPGTCIPICVIAYFMSLLGLLDSKIVFIESICRVKSVSLSGKILLYFADVFAVQWENLSKTSSKIQYFGKLS